MIKDIIESINNNNVIEKFKTLHNMIKTHDTGVNMAFRATLEAVLKHILEIEHNSFKTLAKKQTITSIEIMNNQNFKSKLAIGYDVTNKAMNAFYAIVRDGNKAIHENLNSFEKEKIKERYKCLVLLVVKIVNIEGQKNKVLEQEINDEFERIYNEEIKTVEIIEENKSIEIIDITSKDMELKEEFEKTDSLNFLNKENIFKILNLTQLVQKYLEQSGLDKEEIEFNKYRNFYNFKKYIEAIYINKDISEKEDIIAFEILSYKFEIKEELSEHRFSILDWFYIPKKVKEIEETNGKEKIAEVIDSIDFSKDIDYLEGRYYINEIKPFMVKNKTYFEIEVQKATNRANDKNGLSRVFSTIRIRDNYSVKLKIIKSSIKMHGIETEINILIDYEISIRPAEISRLIYMLMGEVVNTISSKDKFYKALNSYIDKTKMSLLDILLAGEEKNSEFINAITTNSEASYLFCSGMKKARDIIKQDKYESGANILRYLLCFTRLRVLFEQSLSYIKAIDLKQEPKDENVLEELSRNANNKLLHNSNLFIKKDALPFDRNPFSMNLKGHRMILRNLRRCIEIKNREHDMFARYIKEYCNRNQCIFIKQDELNEYGDIKKLAESYNVSLASKNKRIEFIDDYVYIYENVYNTLRIIEKINDFANVPSKFDDIRKNYFLTHGEKIDEEKPINKEQKEVIDKVFNNSRVMILYGEAGTGKTELMCNYLTRLFDSVGYKINYIANTHSAKYNLKKRVSGNFKDKIDKDFKFMTIQKYKNMKKEYDDADVIIIDECKTITTSNIKEIFDTRLKDKKYIILAGDVGQIDSIGFGNWFALAKILAKKECKFELKENQRTSNEELFKLWKKVRNQEPDILDYMNKNNYIEELSSKVFEDRNEDEVIICWNYNGFYGINGINKYFQEKNSSSNKVNIGMEIYKKGTPIVFNKLANKFAKYDYDGDVLYNNLKGSIKWVEEKKYNGEKYVEFQIEIKEYIREEMINNDRTMKEIFAGSHINQIEYQGGNAEIEKTIVTIRTIEHKDRDSDDGEEFVDIPFDVAYAMSLHKAQGLEFDTVKVIITPESEELFDNESFYTAITRAKKNLKIYLTNSKQNDILNILTKKTVEKDAELLKNYIYRNNYININ